MRGVTADILVFRLEELCVMPKTLNFIHKVAKRILNDFKEIKMFKPFVFKDLLGARKEYDSHTIDGELRSDLETVLLSKEGISSLN